MNCLKTKKLKLKFRIFSLGFLGFFVLHYSLFTVLSSAINMRSDNYRIQWGNINIGSGKEASENYQLGITIGELTPGRFSSDGYLVRSGFQYIHSIIPFQFTISDLSIDFGVIVPESPATQTNILTVTAGSAGGWQVTAFESSPLKQRQGQIIADTTCDDGNCTEIVARPWTENTIYGFGYNASGEKVIADFIDNTFFKQFADISIPEIPQIIMESSEATKSASATITYKANVSSLQAAGDYQTNIVFVATPKY